MIKPGVGERRQRTIWATTEFQAKTVFSKKVQD